MIRIANLTKLYPNGTRALSEISTELGIGVTGLLGPNGAGKTTLMRMITGLLLPTSGTIQIDGQNVTAEKVSSVRQSMGYLPQELGLHTTLTIEQELDYFALLKNMRSLADRRKEIDRLLDLVSLQDIRKQRVGTLSGGQKRRVGIAIALLNSPRLIIVDEPTAGLDPAERVRFRNILSHLGEKHQIILSTHIVEDVAQVCQEIVIIRAGEICFQGYIQGLIEQAKGFIWMTSDPDALKSIEPARIISSQQSETEVKIRYLGQPIADSMTVSPTLEDAYLFRLSNAG
jgi:ABC-type multidrug transport system ATPase subunit